MGGIKGKRGKRDKGIQIQRKDQATTSNGGCRREEKSRKGCSLFTCQDAVHATTMQRQRGGDAAATWRRRSGSAAATRRKSCDKTVEEAVIGSVRLCSRL